MSAAAERVTTWEPVDLEPILAGRTVAARPTMLYRSDGPALLYDGKDHAVFGEPESGKGWLALLAVAAQLKQVHVTYFDYEDDAPTQVERLRALGVGDDVIESRFHYVRPDEPITDEGWEQLAPALELSVLAVIDGMNEALALEGLDANSNADVAAWNRRMLGGIKRYGEIALLLIDHVTKDRENRGRNAIGAQHKLAAVDAAYSLHVIEPFGRGRDGKVTIKVRKDRPGSVRTHQNADGEIAHMHLRSRADHSVSITLEPPEETEGTTFRPTELMERLSRAIEKQPGLTKRALRDGVSGSNKWKDLALELLVSEGFVDRDAGPGGHKHVSIDAFRKGVVEGGRAEAVPRSDLGGVPTVPPRADAVPVAQNGTRAAVPPSLKEEARGTPPLATAAEEEKAARLADRFDEESL